MVQNCSYVKCQEACLNIPECMLHRIRIFSPAAAARWQTMPEEEARVSRSPYSERHLATSEGDETRVWEARARRAALPGPINY